MQRHFADELIRRQRDLGHPLCVGLDPHLDLIPALFRQGTLDPGDPRTAEAVESFCGAVIDRIAEKVAIVKPQIAFFERLGWRGMRALHRLVERANTLRLLVLLDAKRGDIGSTADSYARAYLGPQAAMQCDAMTLNPYLGRDALAPFLESATSLGRGLFVLVKTSNRGSGDFQDRRLEHRSTLFETVAETLAEESSALRGPLTDWSSLGVVVGATYPEESERVRQRLPHSLFLVPGYGAQGASAEAALSGFVRGAGGQLEGGLVSSSRGILFPPHGAGDASRWERAIDEALERSIGELARAANPGRQNAS